MTPIERKARELLAAEYAKAGYSSYEKLAMSGRGEFTLCSIRALITALTPPAGGLPELPVPVAMYSDPTSPAVEPQVLFINDGPPRGSALFIAAQLHAYALESIAASRAGWLPIESAPVNTTVLLWNRDTQAVDIGHKPDDAPEPDCVVVSCTASYADAWQPLPAAPQVALNRGVTEP